MGVELLMAGATLAGSAMQADAAGDVADAQAASNADALREQRRQFDLQRQDFAPYREAGSNALAQLVGQMGQNVSAQDVMQDPGYQFGMDQGLRALARRQAAMGGRVSGRALTAATRYGTDYATSGYNAAYQRRQDRLNRLAAIAGIGQTATESSAAAGANSANAISGLLMQGGDNAGAARMAQGNIWTGATNDIVAQYLRQRQPGGASFGAQLDGFFSGTGGSGD